MSFFYLNPVKGNLPVHVLDTIATERLRYLKNIFSGNPAVYNEYIVEGSIYDNVGHFVLCIMTIMGDNTEFRQYFMWAEIELFKRRIKSLAAYDLRCFAKKLIKSIKKHERVPSFIQPLQVLCQHLMLKEIAKHLTSTHLSDCSAHSIPLHFKDCLAFVAKRQVELKDGTAHLPCGKWMQYLVQLYKTHLKHKFQSTNLEPLKSDPRIMEILTKLRREMTLSIPTNSTKALLCKEVENTSKYFPPCMLNLHLTLRKKHRLSHDQRFYYSLFLKDIGMPVKEAVNFWREEYRQNPNGSHSCCHNWERDEKKYLYGIRHMYGLEGGRKSYTSANCMKIQNVSCSEGGCPFKFDSNKMVQILNCKDRCSETLLARINDLVGRKQYTSACLVSLQRYSSHCDTNSFSFTPVKFYNIAAKTNHDEIK